MNLLRNADLTKKIIKHKDLLPYIKMEKHKFRRYKSPKEGSNFNFSAHKKDENYYPQVFLKEC